MESDHGGSITPLKTRQNQRRISSEGHTHSQRRTPSLQDKPIPDLTPPPQRSPVDGIAPIKPRQDSFGSPLAPKFREDTPPVPREPDAPRAEAPPSPQK